MLCSLCRPDYGTTDQCIDNNGVDVVEGRHGFFCDAFIGRMEETHSNSSGLLPDGVIVYYLQIHFLLTLSLLKGSLSMISVGIHTCLLRVRL